MIDEDDLRIPVVCRRMMAEEETLKSKQASFLASRDLRTQHAAEAYREHLARVLQRPAMRVEVGDFLHALLTGVAHAALVRRLHRDLESRDPQTYQ